MKQQNPATSPLEAHLGYWLRFVSNHVAHAFSRKLEARGVTVAEWVVLRALFGQEAATPGRLASRLGMSRGAISKLTDRLVDKSLVTRQPNESDHRSHALTLTAMGSALVPKLSALADQNDAEFFGQLKPTERATIQNAMQDTVRRHRFKTVPTE